MSKWLFVRHYLLVILLILGVGGLMDRMLQYDSEQITLINNNKFLKGNFLYIASIFTEGSQNIEQVWAAKHLQLQEELGYPLAMYQRTDFSDISQFAEFFANDQVVALETVDAGIIYYSPLRNSEYIFALGPVYEQNNNISFDLLLIIIYHILVASILFLWFAPLARDLQKLRKVASNFGAENFSARIKLGKNSSIALVADAFNGMAQRIQTLVSAHKDLTHAVSHELKTPLARFKFSLEIIEGIDDKQKQSCYLQGMKQDVRELDELIDEMLSYARLDVQNLQLNLEEVSAEQWLRDLVRQYAQEEIKVSFKFNKHTCHTQSLLIDRHLMNRAMHNLIRNGLRYAENDVQISLCIDPLEVDLRVDDDGQGIPEQCRAQVLQPFMRLDTSRDKQSGGYGLGLAIVNKIVHQHGGQMTVDNSPLGGARFCISLPQAN
jgi:signal transduction histidine kinase